MIVVRVDDRSFNQTMNNAIKNTNRVGNKILWGMAKRCATEIKKAIIMEGHDSSGNLRRRTRARKISNGNYVVSMPYYVKYLEEGTSPHWIPYSNRALIWARKHRIPFWIMRQRIAESGTQAYPFVSRAVMKAQMRNRTEVIQPTMNVFVRSRFTTMINT